MDPNAKGALLRAHTAKSPETPKGEGPSRVKGEGLRCAGGELSHQSGVNTKGKAPVFQSHARESMEADVGTS